MQFSPKLPDQQPKTYGLDGFQRVALGGMLVLSVLTFIGANLHAVLWQSSDWLVSTVLPAVVVKLTNDERTNLAAPPLRRSTTLDEAARRKAQHMAQNEYFAHYAPDGTSPWYWFDQAGYVYAYAGENLAIHFTDSEEVVAAWMKSPTHRENIVSGAFTEIGVGTAKGEFEGYDTVYVVQLFGTPAQEPVVSSPEPPPVAITQAPAVTEIEESVAAEDGNEAVLAVSEQVPTPETPIATSSTTSEPMLVIDNPPLESQEIVESVPSDIVILETSLVSTSSGLAVATIDEPPQSNESPTGELATKPNTLLQITYTLFGFIVVGLLLASVVVEACHTRYMQMVYGVGLLAIMVGLWYIHTLLTTGAVIV